jgi:methylthioribose-1-phosphate isomerase
MIMGLRGVNLGNWLVLEKWMGASPLSSAKSEDDRGLIDEFEPEVLAAALEEHRSAFITEDDFAWMEREGIDLFTSAADAICLDGTVVNKVGTFQIAIAANYLGVPYYVTGAPDRGMRTRADVTIEMRDPGFVLQAMGTRTAAQGVKGYYPSFDITPPHLVSGVVTDCGIYVPYDLPRYFKDSDGEFGQGGLNL